MRILAVFAFLMSLISLILPWISSEILGFIVAPGFQGASILSIALTGGPFKIMWLSSQQLTYASILASVTTWIIFLCILFGSLTLLLKKRKMALLPATFAILSLFTWCIALQYLNAATNSSPLYPGFGSGLMLISGCIWIWSYLK